MSAEYVVLGRINGFYGIQGWVKVFSYTVPITNILHYSPWQLLQGEQRQTVAVLNGKQNGKGIIAQLATYSDRETVAHLLGADIVVLRTQLPPPIEGEYYWHDLVGLQVVNEDHICLGQVEYVLETGANDVLVVKGQDRERLIPFLFERVVKKVDLTNQIIQVEWDVTF